MIPQKTSIPILDLPLASNPEVRQELLSRLKSALFETGFLYIVNHGIPQSTLSALTSRLPALFSLPDHVKAAVSKRHSPHFLGYSGFAEEITQGKTDLREQFDFATEPPVVWGRNDQDKLYWRLRGPNLWPEEGDESTKGFRLALEEYMREVEQLSYEFIHLIEEAFEIPLLVWRLKTAVTRNHRLKLIKYPPSLTKSRGQGVGAHKDSSGWLTFLLEVGDAPEEMDSYPRHPGSLVVNFGNAFEAATGGSVKATVHRVLAPKNTSPPRYSIPFFMGLPLNMTVSAIKQRIPEKVHKMRGRSDDEFGDRRWEEEELGVSQLRKWFRSHPEVAESWYGVDAVDRQKI
ncbi:Clavaminate synthase-like protein [Choiromyces venosus 120613-1]|uniref:Clavaminate synthase-like protein n=1 Tax=Choiromyces venosus 120613-1 TaxID=1336337 RepID=A0A3N4JYM7_9PEZI|nr:Clavaminate synthase-like protein [Choiromyces venosus 120613-1]